MGFQEERRRRAPFCSATSLRLATCQTAPLTLYSQNINKEPATQRARSKYNVPSDLPSLLPRFTAFLVLIHIVERPLPSRGTSPLLSRSHTFHLLILSRFPSFIPLLRDPSFSSSLSRSLGSFFALSESLRRDLNSSLPAPFPDFSSVKSALCRAHPRPARFSHREPRDNS